MKFYVVLFAAILACGVCIAQQQDEWDVPIVQVGDSSDWVEDDNVIVTGRVFATETDEPLSSAPVSVNSFQYFDYTDSRGMYVLEIPPGVYKVKVKHVGMLPVYLRLRIVSGGVLDIPMKAGAVNLSEVVITARPLDSNVRSSLAGTLKMDVQEIKSLPTLMGEIDIMKTLQLMPGVTSVGEGASGLNVRGGRVDQNLVLLNDAPLFNTSHALGFVSALNQDIVKDFSLYKGNVPAQFGGRASSVLEINSRRGDFEKWKFQNAIGPVTSRVTADGPLINGKTSLILSGRMSYADWALHLMSNPDVARSSSSFYDGFASLSHRFSKSSLADVTFYTSKDKFRFSNQFGYSWQTSLATAKWQAWTDRKASPVMNLSYGYYETRLTDPNGVDASTLTNSMKYFQLKPIVNVELDDSHKATGGLSLTGYFPGNEKIAGYAGNTAVVPRTNQKERGIEFAAFAHDEFEVTDRVALSGGIRFSYYSQLGADSVFSYLPNLARIESNITDTTVYSKSDGIVSYHGLEPRFSFRYNITETKSLKVSFNRMFQYIHLISNTTAPTPIDLWQVSTTFLRPQASNNYSLGYFWNIKDNRWETSIEMFYKTSENLVEYRDFPSLYLNNHIETELLSGRGKAYGAELYVRRIKGRWTGWLSYTYSQTMVQVASSLKSEQINGGRWFQSNYNKPHNVNLVLNRRYKGDGAFSLVMTFNSGRPFTAIESSYVAGGTVVPIYSDRNEYNIPNYFRIDLSITIGNVVRRIDDSLVISLYNIFGRDNSYSIFYKRPASNYFIPKAYKLSVLGAVLPSISYNFKF